MDENASTSSSLVAGLLDTQQTGPGGGSLDQDDSGIDPVETNQGRSTEIRPHPLLTEPFTSY